MIVAIIQARMTSSRLPGKVLREVGGRPLLDWMLSRVRRSRQLDKVVMATTVNGDDDPVAHLCARLGVDVWRGDEHDVLGRYRDAAAHHGADVVVRLTADCPMCDPTLIDDAIAVYRSSGADHVYNRMVPAGYPNGLDVEVFSRAALESAAAVVTHPILREHVTSYIRGSRPNLPKGDFRLAAVPAPADFRHVRWTVDTEEDLARVAVLLETLPEGFSWFDALSLATQKPDLLGV